MSLVVFRGYAIPAIEIGISSEEVDNPILFDLLRTRTKDW